MPDNTLPVTRTAGEHSALGCSSELAELRQQVRALYDLFFRGKGDCAMPATNANYNVRIKRGFVDDIAPPRTWVYVGDKDDCCWYRVVDGKVIPIHESCLVGRLIRIFGAKREHQGRPTYKLCFEVEADSARYVIQTGVETQFAKGLIAAIDVAPDDILRGDIAIRVRAGDSSKVVFASLHAMPSGDRIRADSVPEDGKAVADMAAAIDARLGVEWSSVDFTSRDRSPASPHAARAAINQTHNGQTAAPAISHRGISRSEHATHAQPVSYLDGSRCMDSENADDAF